MCYNKVRLIVLFCLALLSDEEATQINTWLKEGNTTIGFVRYRASDKKWASLDLYQTLSTLNKSFVVVKSKSGSVYGAYKSNSWKNGNHVSIMSMINNLTTTNQPHIYS